MTTEDYPAQEHTVWLFPVFITEFLLTSIINAVTITAFARIHHLRKRSTYLIINLTVADLLVGAVTGPLFVYQMKETAKDDENQSFDWPRFMIMTFEGTFPIASQVNLCLISLERLHATLFPFRHCLISEWVYVKIIVASWAIPFLLASLVAGLHLNKLDGNSYVWASFTTLILLVLTVSYIIIILNVQRSPHSQNHGLIRAERKLSVTLFIVTGVSVLTILPWAIYNSMPVDIHIELSNTLGVETHYVLAVIYLASSVGNPLVYAMRMQEFRKAIGELVCKFTERSS
ncbi:melanocortin receptor 4-like [Oculina patagonica]